MTIESFEESGMTFGPYPENYCCFRIEKSAIYEKLKDGVKIAELLLLRLEKNAVPAVWVVEAKSSAPQHFDKFVTEIHEKLSNTLTLGVAACLNRHAAAGAELPEMFKTLDLKTADFKLVLVINEHQKAWLPPLQEAMKKALNATVKTWGMSPESVAVINDEIARNKGLIS